MFTNITGNQIKVHRIFCSDLNAFIDQYACTLHRLFKTDDKYLIIDIDKYDS